MDIKTLTIECWKINDPELPSKVKGKILEKQGDINVDYPWWSITYDDAKEVGLKITHFDFDRRKEIGIEFLPGHNGETVAKKIMEIHDDTTMTYAHADRFLKDIAKIEGLDQDEAEAVDTFKDLQKTFLDFLGSQYLVFLEQDYYHRISEEAVIETLEANDYDFDEYGNIV